MWLVLPSVFVLSRSNDALHINSKYEHDYDFQELYVILTLLAYTFYLSRIAVIISV